MAKLLNSLRHAAGTGNGSVDRNKASVAFGNSFFNWKPTEVHIHQHELNTAGKLLLAGAGLAIGVVSAGATSKLFNSTAETSRVSGRRQEGTMRGVEEHDSQEEVIKESMAMLGEAQIESSSTKAPTIDMSS